MKTKIITMLFVFFMLSNAVQGQTKTFSYYAKETLQAIGTSAEQNEKILSIHKLTQSQIREIQKDNQLTEEMKKEKYKVVYGESAKQYNEVLSAEQKEKLKQYIKDFKNK